MASTTPLTGIELIDCAKANGNQDVVVAAERYGYGNNIALFEQQLRDACEEIGIHNQEFSRLNDIDGQTSEDDAGVIIAPDTSGQI